MRRSPLPHLLFAIPSVQREALTRLRKTDTRPACAG